MPLVVDKGPVLKAPIHCFPWLYQMLFSNIMKVRLFLLTYFIVPLFCLIQFQQMQVLIIKKLVGNLIGVSYGQNYKTAISDKITCWEGEQFP